MRSPDRGDVCRLFADVAAAGAFIGQYELPAARAAGDITSSLGDWGHLQTTLHNLGIEQT